MRVVALPSAAIAAASIGAAAELGEKLGESAYIAPPCNALYAYCPCVRRR